MRAFLLGALSVVLLAFVIGFITLHFGLYPVNADTDPSWLERKLANWAVDSHVRSQAKSLPENPVKPTPENLTAGLKGYKNNCAGCHGSPADKEGLFGRSFFPKAPQFWRKGLHDEATEVFWITKHGIRMSGMPAFGSMLQDDEIWKIVTFIKNIEKLPADVKNEWELQK